MARIRPFRGLRPASENSWPWDFLSKEAAKGRETEYLQNRLEPKGAVTPVELWAVRDYLSELVSERNYLQDPQLGIYVYERIAQGGSTFGVFALARLSELTEGTPNEDRSVQQLAEHSKAYRQHVGLQGSAALVTHEHSRVLTELIANAFADRHGYFYTIAEEVHRFVRVTSPGAIRDFQLAMAALKEAQLIAGPKPLDGHDRVNNGLNDWVFSLFLEHQQLSPVDGHQLLQPMGEQEIEEAKDRIGEYFFVSKMPNNAPCRPSKKHRIGMWAGGTWYQLDLRPEVKMDHPVDAVFLQEKIIKGIFEITDEKITDRAKGYPDSDFQELLDAIAERPGSVAFTLCPLGAEEMLADVVDGSLPIGPMDLGLQPPYGLLMHSNRQMDREGKE